MKTFARALRATLPVMAGYLVLGTGFGLILKSKGFTALHALLMSTFIYAGSMQFAALDLMGSLAALPTIALTTLMVNLRHLFYSISMIDSYKHAGAVKPYLIFGLTDETYSLAVADSGESTAYYTFITLLDHMYWIGGSMLCVLMGSLIKVDTRGLDFALTALFVSIFVDKLRDSASPLPGVTGVGTSLVCLLLLGPDRFLIPTMALITLVLVLLDRKDMAHE